MSDSKLGRVDLAVPSAPRALDSARRALPAARVAQGDRLFELPDLLRAAESSWAGRAPAGGPAKLAVCLPDGPWTCAALAWALQRGGALALFPQETAPGELEARSAELGCTHLWRAASGAPAEAAPELRELLPAGTDDSPREPAPGGATLLTSGTTGVPKVVHHDWDSLLSGVAIRDDLAAARWLCLYPLSRFAGLNAALHALANGSLLIAPGGTDLAGIRRHIECWRPTHAAATPTLWKLLLMDLPADASVTGALRQVTLGGEIADQPVLDALRTAFPRARVTHVYAGTESGVCLSVSDGLAGFPAAWLDREDRDVALTLREGELWVRRRGSRSETLRMESRDGWWPTGDQVRRVGDRCMFLGRREDIINVGGAKVAPGEVESCIAGIAGVVSVRVHGRPSTISGSVLVADIVVAPGADEEALRGTVLSRCRARLPAHSVPRIVRFTHTLSVDASGKRAR